MGNGLLKKLKTGFVGLGLIGASYFNAKAQENSISRYDELNKLGFVEAMYLRYESKPNEKYTPKYNTIAHKMLMIEDSGKVCSYPPLRKLDEVIDYSKKFIKKTHYTKQELSDLSKKIYLTINAVDFNLAHDSEEGAFLMMPTLEACYIYSLYYLAVGEANNLPFYAVNFEKNIEYTNFIFKERSLGHIFIRYDPDGKHDVLNSNAQVNQGDINIEATAGEIQKSQNGEYSDNYYINKYELPTISLKKGISLVNLNEKRLLELAYGKRSFKNIVYAAKVKIRLEDNLDKEIKDCKLYRDPSYGYKSPATQSQNEECWKKNNLKFRQDSIIKENNKLINESIKSFDKIIESNPNSFLAHYCKGSGYLFLDTKDSSIFSKEISENKNFVIKKAIESYIKASELAPNPEIYKKIANLYYLLDKEGCYKDLEYITKAINLVNENIKKEKNLEKLKDLKDRLEILNGNKKEIEKDYEPKKWYFNRCDTTKKSK